MTRSIATPLADQRNRDQLRDLQTVAGLWLDPRLQQYRRERIAHEHIETSGLAEAADRLLAVHQCELRERKSDIDRAVALELFLAGKWAIAALRHVRGDKFAKERQIYHSDGRPLAVCAGSLKLGAPFKTAIGSYRAPAHGCLCVFEDSIRTAGGGKRWRWFCPDCTHAKRQRRRDQERALQRQARIVRKQRFGSSPM